MKKIILALAITTTSFINANQCSITQKNLLANQIHKVYKSKASVANFLKLEKMLLQYNCPEITSKEIKVDEKQKFLKAKGLLVLIIRTGGKADFFRIFEKEFIKNELNFKKLNLVNLHNYQEIKTDYFKKIIKDIISSGNELTFSERMTATCLLAQQGGIDLNKLNVSISIKKAINKESDAISKNAKKSIEDMLKTKKTIVNEKFVDKFLKKLELVNFSKNKTSFSEKNFFEATYLYHQIVIKEHLGVEKALLKKLYQKIKAGNVNLANLPLSL